MSKILRSILLFSLIISVISCEKSTPEPISVVDIQQDFDIIPIQDLGDQGPYYQLIIRSKTLSECENDLLDASLIQSEDKLIIQINGNISPENCQEGSIYTEKLFDMPSNPGIYSIEVKQGSLTSTSGTINITESSFEIDIEELGGIYIEESSLNTIPEDLVWGYFLLDEAISTNATSIEEIAQELYFEIDEYTNLSPGNYSLFTVDSDGNLILADKPNKAGEIVLLVPDSMQWENLKRQMTRLTEIYPSLKYEFTRFDGLQIWN